MPTPPAGMPLFYKHWSFGKHFAHHEAFYRKGLMGLAYEIVINSLAVHFLSDGGKHRDHADAGDRACGVRPQSFLQEQLSVQAMDRCRRHSRLSRFREELCRAMRGASRPAAPSSSTLDAAHALMSHGIDRYPGKKKLDLRAEEKRADERRLHEESAFNDLWRTVPTGPAKSAADAEQPSGAATLLGLPQENLLYFLEKSAPRLQPWQRELLRIVRHIAQYFYPAGPDQGHERGHRDLCALPHHDPAARAGSDFRRQFPRISAVAHQCGVSARVRRSALFGLQSLCARLSP